MKVPPALLLHIVAATVGLISGTVTMLLRKGSPRHAGAGNVFTVSMLLMSSSGAWVGFTRSQPMNVCMGCFTFYLVSTGWWAARRRERAAGLFDRAAFLFVAAVIAGMVASGLHAAHDPILAARGGVPLGVYFFFASVAFLFAAADVRLLVRRGVAGTQRITRHLWRMGFAFLIAVFSFFLGQQKVFPAAWRGATIWFAPPLLVLVSILFWLIRVKFAARFKRPMSIQGIPESLRGLSPGASPSAPFPGTSTGHLNA